MIKEMLNERKLPKIPLDREEIKEILQREEYGYLPPKPEMLSFEKIRKIEGRFPCRAELSEHICKFTVGGKSGEFPFRTAIHSDGLKRPFFVHINFRADTPDLYAPTEEILDNDFNIISFCYTDVTSDDGDFTTGIAPLFIKGERRDTDCGKIILWAWAAMRMLDFAEGVAELDMDNSAVIGHSRLGKTALVTAMLDERFKFCFSNNAGCSGDAITRGKIGEHVDVITRVFPFWFCENYKKYADGYDDMPFDQHFIFASVAPRYVYTGASTLDSWADPDSQYLCCCASSEYFERLGVPGFVAEDRLPKAGDFFHDGHIGYHLKDSEHFLSRHDWVKYMEFFKRKVKENEGN